MFFLLKFLAVPFDNGGKDFSPQIANDANEYPQKNDGREPYDYKGDNPLSKSNHEMREL